MIQGLCYSFLLELLQGVHDFSSDTFKIAIYEESASVGQGTTEYTTAGEVSGTGYVAGGTILSVSSGYPKLYSGTCGAVSFDNVLIPGYGFNARYALVYNASKNNRAVCVIDFGEVYAVTASIEIFWPDSSTTYPIIMVRN